MHLGSVGFHSCIRQLKQGMCLEGMGVKVHLVSAMVPEVHDVSGFTTVNMYTPVDQHGRVSERQLAETVRALDPTVDIWNVHNEPNWIFRVVRQNTQKKIVFDIHDWTSIRENPIPEEVRDEEYALEHADAFVVPSKGYLQKIRGVSKKPSVLVYSKVPSFLYPESAWPKKPGLVYEGGVKGKDPDFVYNYPYRNWADFCRAAAEHTKVYLYSANGGDDFGDYQNPNITLSMPLEYRSLLKALSQHSVGIVGSPYPLPDFTDSMPNKLFEYISAGIPVIVLNAPEAAKFVEEHGLGLSVRDASEVPNALEKLTEHNVLNERWKFSMDSEITPLISILETLCQKNRRRIAQMAG